MLISVVGLTYGSEPDLVKDKIRQDRKAHADRLIDWLGINRNDVVVDFGSGVGFIAEWIAPKANRLHCMDIGEHHLAYARDHLKTFDNVSCAHISCADFSSLQGLGVTKLYSTAVMIHFNFWDIAIHLEKIYEALEPGGIAHIDFVCYDGLDVYSDAMWQFQLQSYKQNFSPNYLVTWHSSSAIQRLAQSIGFSTKVTHVFPSGATGILFLKPR